jgi:hypothetical protein
MVMRLLSYGDLGFTADNYTLLDIARVMSSGSIIWAKRFDCDTSIVTPRSFNLIEGDHGNILVTAKEGLDLFVVMVNANGNPLWSKRYRTVSDNIEAHALERTPQGFMIGGWHKNAAQTIKGFLMEIDYTGNVLWFRNYDSGNGFYIKDIVQLSTSTYALRGRYAGSNGKPVIIVADGSGNIIHSKPIDNAQNLLPSSEAIEKDLSGNLLYLSTIPSNGVHFYRAQGSDMLWCDSYFYPVSSSAYPFSYTVEPDLYQYSVNGTESLALYTAPVIFAQNNYCSNTGMGEPGAPVVEVYPNPFFGSISVRSETAFKGAIFELCDVTGRKLVIKKLDAATEEISVSGLHAGMYFYRITSASGLVGTGKLRAE